MSKIVEPCNCCKGKGVLFDIYGDESPCRNCNGIGSFVVVKRPPMVDAFFQGRKLTGKMKQAVVDYIERLEVGQI